MAGLPGAISGRFAHSAALHTTEIQDLLVPLATGILSLVAFALTLAPDLTWANFGGDGGELITASVTLGIPHPPGYPTYVILGKLISLLPIGVVSWRFNLFSALSAATSAAFVTAIARDTLAGDHYRNLASMAAGLSIAFTALVWSQAAITEVYPLNLAVLTVFMWALLGRRSALVCGLFLGLSVTTHLSSLLMLPMAIALTPAARWKQLAAGGLLGLLPLLALPFFDRLRSPVVWGNPSNAGNWWRLVTGQLYHANLRLPESGALSSVAASIGSTLLRQFAWAGWLVVALGITTGKKTRRVTIWLLLTGALYVFYAFLYRTDDAFVNLLPVLILISPLLAAGLSRAGAWSPLFPLGLLLLNVNASDLSADHELRPRALQILESAPPQAILVTPGDRSIFALWYFHHVEDVRGDLAIVDDSLLAFDWYRQRLGSQHPNLQALGDDGFADFREINGRRQTICDVPPDLTGTLACEPPE